MREITFILGIILLAGFLAADVGPGPDPSTLPYVEVTAYYNGNPVPDGTLVEVDCYAGGDINYVPTTTLYCTGGICRNTGWYKLSPCVSAEDAGASFRFSSSSFATNYTTPPVPIKGGWTYKYLVQIDSASDAVSITENGAPVKNGGGGICPGVLMIFGFVSLAGFAAYARK